MAQPTCHRRTTCRLCGGAKLARVLALAPTPPANAFVSAEALDEPQAAFPLDVYLCARCTHLQLLDVVDADALFADYVYVSSTSKVFVEHFRRYADDVVQRHGVAPGALAVDIGSNDGTLLGFFKERGLRVLGVDPARAIAEAASGRGIETIASFFTPDLARDIRERYGPARVVTANNVFAHADDLAGIRDGVAALLAPDGVFVLEVSYVVDVYEKALFDTIYHEHLAYHAVAPLIPFLAAGGLEAIAAERIDTHGGSLRVTAQARGGPRAVALSVAALVALEKGLAIGRAETWRGFAERIAALGESLGRLLGDLKAQGKSIAGYGAPAKATTLMHHFRLGAGIIDFIADDSPLKQGLYTPGLHVPVLPPAAIYERRPDYLVILAWNFAPSIMANHAAYVESGGRFIVPLPKLEVH